MALDCAMLESWAELESWQRLTKTPIHPVEADLVMGFSRAYRNAYYRFDGQDVPRPYFDPKTTRNESSIRNTLRNRND